MKKIHLILFYLILQLKSYSQQDTLSTLPHWIKTDSTYNFSSTTDTSYQNIELLIINRETIKFNISLSAPNKWPFLENKSITGTASFATIYFENEPTNENITSWYYYALNETLQIGLELDENSPHKISVNLFQMPFSNRPMK
tara:strand:+ start:94 stop:519 length:426 start_codon:yes stop_codon:yes gene_type:complete